MGSLLIIDGLIIGFEKDGYKYKTVIYRKVLQQELRFCVVDAKLLKWVGNDHLLSVNEQLCIFVHV